jgi:DNA-directed RNA polymerase specialized sigma24 family protein
MSQVLDIAPALDGSVLTGTDEDRGYELLRRAICERDDDAWTSIVVRYERLVRSWVRQQHSGLDPSEEAAYVNRAFARFWRAIGPERFVDFKDLSALLGYLKMCAGSVVLDDLRAAHRHPAVSQDGLMAENASFQGPSAPDDPDAEVSSDMSAELLWTWVESVLPLASDRLLAQLSFVDGLPPALISQRHPDVFPTAQDVYRRKALVLDRLRRSATTSHLID